MLTLRRVWAAAVLLLLAVTHRLWLPTGLSLSDPVAVQAAEQAAGGIPAFPGVPMLALSGPWPLLLDAVGLLGLLLALSLITGSRRGAGSPWPYVTIIATLPLLFVVNQHRLQPWAYQAWLYGWLFACCYGPLAERRQQRWLVILTAGVYGFSALGKFDYQFLNTVGPQLLRGMLRWSVGEETAADWASQRWLVAMLPIAELSIAVGLLWQRVRHWAGWAAVTMHAALLADLGPWALDHSGGVLGWNAFLAFQAWYCFAAPPKWGGPPPLPERHSPAPPAAARGLAAVVLLMAMVMPLLERIPRQSVATGWDHWLSWALYSPHTSRADIEVHGTAVPLLPPIWQRYLQRSADRSSDWYTVDLGRWSLEQRSVPVYPQARFQLGLAMEIAGRLQAAERGTAIRVKLRSVSDRWTGQRTQQWALGHDEIVRLADSFWLLGHSHVPLHSGWLPERSWSK